VYEVRGKVLNIVKTITTLKIKLPASGEMLTKTILLTKKHKAIEPLFDKKFWENFSGVPVSKSGGSIYKKNFILHLPSFHFRLYCIGNEK